MGVDIFMFDSEMCHLGNINTDIQIEARRNQVRDTLFELFFIANAKSIKTYSVYPWTSGFVKMISLIYDIPIHSSTYIGS